MAVARAARDRRHRGGDARTTRRSHEVKPIREWRASLACLASGLLFFFGTGLHPLWVLTWLAPVPVLALAIRASWGRALVVAALAMLIGGLNEVPYLARLAPLPVVAIALLLPSLAFGACVTFFRVAARRWPRPAALLALPAAWTAFEFLLSFNPGSGSVTSLGYTQVTVLPVLQLAALTGIWGISFLVMLVASGLAIAWDRPDRWVSALTMPAAVLGIVLVFGFARLRAPVTGAPLTVGLATADSAMRFFDAAGGDTARTIATSYAASVDSLAARGARFVVLPEKAIAVTRETESGVLTPLTNRARALKVGIVAGLNHVDPPPRRNVASVIGEDGDILLEYNKTHLVPGYEEDYAPGTTIGIFDSSWGKLGVAVCKDLDFPRSMRAYGHDGVRVLFVPAWDFGEDGELHARIAVVRGVENGFALARTAARGRLTVTDDRGRFIGDTASDAGARVLAVYDAPLGSGSSPYAQWGDWFAWACVAGTLTLLAAGWPRIPTVP
jgi:apolipoprotein N-acyltransferase